MLTLAELPAEADAYPLLARRVKKEKLYEKKGPRAFAKRSAFESFDDYLDKTYRLRRKNMRASDVSGSGLPSRGLRRTTAPAAAWFRRT